MNTLKTGKDIQKKKIFIVDDHVILREGLSELINRERDLTVCGESENVSNALQAITECKPDIVIVDITLEDGSGIRLIQDLKYYNPGLPVLVLSMHDEFVYAERCLRAGARGYIMKQEPSSKFVSAIRKILNGNIYFSEKLGATVVNKLFSNNAGISNSVLEGLSNRELELYQLIGQGLKKREIAARLNLSIRTIENYMANIKKKMNFEDTHDIVVHAVKSTTRG